MRSKIEDRILNIIQVINPFVINCSHFWIGVSHPVLELQMLLGRFRQAFILPI
jgi:hypothetical protein